MKPREPKEKACSYRPCHRLFTPQRMGQKVCGPVCAMHIARAKREKDEQRARSDERKKDRETRDRLKTRSDWMKDAQKAFNAFIRQRDKDTDCICCGASLDPTGPGGGVDAGHYRSVGSAPHLRFDERNCHAQTKKCNRYGAGRAVDYRRGLIARIGLAAVEALESDQAPRKFTIDELKAITQKYRQLTRQLQAGATVETE